MVTIKTTRWSPDTCNCVLEYTWDADLPDDQIVHTFSNVVNACSAHTALTGNNRKDNYDAVFEECKRKNFIIQELVDRATNDFINLNADGNWTWKPGITVTWTWSGTAPNRVITFTLAGKLVTAQRKTQIQNFLNNRFGVGKVIFVNTA